MDKIINQAYEFSVKLNSALEGIQIPNVDSHFLPALFHSTVIEHHRSIILLIQKHLYSSASTLARPLFESYVKGLWFSDCATQKDFDRLRKDKFEVAFNKLVTDVDSKRKNGLSKPKENYWSTLNSLTHSGAAQLGRKYKNNEISNSHTQPFLENILDFSANYALLSCVEIIKLSGNQTALKEIVDLANSKHGL